MSISRCVLQAKTRIDVGCAGRSARCSFIVQSGCCRSRVDVAWSALRAALGLRLPELVRPWWVVAMAMVIGCVLVVDVSILVRRSAGVGLSMFAMLSAACLFSVVLCLGTRPFAVLFRGEFATVRGLTTWILQHNYGTLSDERRLAHDDEVWATLRDLIVKQLGVRPEEVTKEASFVEDLVVGVLCRPNDKPQAIA